MKDFKIDLTNPPVNNVYYPGMTVTGIVTGSTDEPKDYKAIQVRLLGGANVHWSEVAPGPGGQGTQILHFWSSESYIDTSTVLWDKDMSTNSGYFPVGPFQLPFSFRLTSNKSLPPSFKGKAGRISYTIEAIVIQEEESKKSDDKSCHVQITLANVVPINQPDLMQPQSKETSKTICCLCCASGPIVITACIPRMGYCAKTDTIPVEISVENGSNRDVRELTISIQKVIEYRANGRSHFDNIHDTPLYGNFHQTIAEVRGEGVRAHNSIVWNGEIRVPDTPTTLKNGGIIEISYFLRVSGSLTLDVNAIIDLAPIVIGNVPLEEPLSIAGSL